MIQVSTELPVTTQLYFFMWSKEYWSPAKSAHIGGTIDLLLLLSLEIGGEEVTIYEYHSKNWRSLIKKKRGVCLLGHVCLIGHIGYVDLTSGLGY